MITADTLSRFAPRIVDAAGHAAALEAARAGSSVTTARRLCHFMAQIYVETGGFRTLEENLNWRNAERLDAIFKAVHGVDDARELIARGPEAIANRVYANKIGNGDEDSGDGWRYRGSGYIQLTGRDNYRRIGEAVGIDLEGKPDLAREPVGAARVAFGFWDARDCSPLADTGDVEEITRLINGPGMLGLAERREATVRALDIWS